MKKSNLILLTAVLSLTGCGSSQSSSSSSSSSIYSLEATLAIDTTSSTKKIEKGIYGQFIEFLGDGIYGGLWSELIMDRKFYSPIGKESSQWTSSGTADIVSASEATYSGGYAPSFSTGAAISQSGLTLNAKTYDGYFYAQGEGNVSVSLLDSAKSVVSTKSLSVTSSSFAKLSYSFDVSEAGNYSVSFACTSGNFILDSFSLMPSDNISGFRADTIALLKEINAPVYRYPGGNFVSGYNWEDGIGDRDQRKNSRNQEYAGAESDYDTHDEMVTNDIMNIESLGFCGVIDPNDVGIDEFITFCKLVGAEPNIVVNSGLGTSQEAANEVSYCNSLTGTYANKRPSAKPYAVNLWSIGNEMNGDWQLGYVSLSEYVIRHRQFYSAMKAVDDSITVIAVGDNTSNWSRQMVSSCSDNFDYLSEHLYATRDETDPKAHIKSLSEVIKTRIANHIALGTDKGMSIDEYSYDKAESASRLKDGMGVALGLNVMINNADVVKMACYSSTVNITQGCVITDSKGAYMEGAGYVLSLYRKYNQGNFIPSTLSVTSSDVVEAVATISDDKSALSLAVVNSSNNPVSISSSLKMSNIKRYSVVGKYLDSTNDASRTELVFESEEEEKMLAPAYSVSIFVASL